MKRKLGNSHLKEDQADGRTVDEGEQTPTKRRRSSAPNSKINTQITPNGKSQVSVTKTPSRSKKGKDLNTSTKLVQTPTHHATTNGVSNADLSARKKSARTLIGHTISGHSSDEDDLDEEEDMLAEKVWNQGEEEIDEDDEAPLAPDEESGTGPSTTATPSKRGRGRAKGSTRKRSPTAPQNLPPHEQYFFQNRPGGNKTSTNTLASLSLLNHEEYFNLMRDYVDPHEPEREFLRELHSRSFAQWRFEMTEGFSICLYGWGSKRKLIMDYAEWLYAKQCEEVLDEEDRGKVVVVNGYVSNLSVKDVISILATGFFGLNHTHKLGGQPGEMVGNFLSLLNEHQPKPITLIIHSIDSPSLRRLSTQTLLSRLASHESIHLLASADHPSFPLLWDSNLRETFNFIFHDSTTFDPFVAEFDVVDSVNELLGRSARQVAGKEGVGYVLKSLPENARNLYRVLVSEQLAGIEEGISGERNGTGGDEGVEYRVLYQKAVEEFICSSEIAFRTLLKE